jgi:hypothetical protein
MISGIGRSSNLTFLMPSRTKERFCMVVSTYSFFCKGGILALVSVRDIVSVFVHG